MRMISFRLLLRKMPPKVWISIRYLGTNQALVLAAIVGEEEKATLGMERRTSFVSPF